MSFQKTKEDFVCEKCGESVAGDGYTNHCPSCLWSKHVDIDPGDRAATCGGMMKPVALEGATPEYTIVHECEACGHQRRNRAQAQDDTEAILALARR